MIRPTTNVWEMRLRAWSNRCSLIIGPIPRGNRIAMKRFCNQPIDHDEACRHDRKRPDVHRQRRDVCRRCGDWLSPGAEHDCRTAVPA